MSQVLLNLGCGANLLPPPWKNLDLDRPDPKDRVDIMKPLPFADNSVDMILIEHCLEHVNCSDGMRFLLEAHRVLKLGGVLRVCVPILQYLSSKDALDICINHGHQQIYTQQLLSEFFSVAGFSKWETTERKEIDGHWKQIGEQKDALETLRMEATK